MPDPPITPRLQYIVERPTAINQVHESMYRAHHILAYVRQLLADGAPAPAVLRVLDDLLAWPQRAQVWRDGRLVDGAGPAGEDAEGG